MKILMTTHQSVASSMPRKESPRCGIWFDFCRCPPNKGFFSSVVFERKDFFQEAIMLSQVTRFARRGIASAAAGARGFSRSNPLPQHVKRGDLAGVIGTVTAVAGAVGAYTYFSTSSKHCVKDYSSNGPVAKRIASVTPYFPFKGIERFYDIGGFLKDPEAFQLAIDVFVERYKDKKIDCIVGVDARGFVLGPPIALALKVPFVMLRKKGKMPNAITGKEYSKEYAGNDSLSIPRGSVQPGDRVVVIDDLVATGGTLVASVDLVKTLGGEVVECACVVELKFLNAAQKFKEHGHDDVPIWALMDEVRSMLVARCSICTSPLFSFDICAHGVVDAWLCAYCCLSEMSCSLFSLWTV